MHTTTPTDSQPRSASVLQHETGQTGTCLRLVAAQVDGPRGRVFGPLTAASDRPVTVVHGAAGSGRTSLLLAIAGRMRLAGGGVETLGETRASAIRNMTGIAGFAGIDDLEPAVTVAATLRERLSWELPWWRRTPRISEEVAGELLDPAFGSMRDATRIVQPDSSLLCRELTPADDLLVRIALALIARPELLVIDDLDAVRDPHERERVAARVREIATQTPVVIATSDSGDAALFDEPAIINL